MKCLCAIDNKSCSQEVMVTRSSQCHDLVHGEIKISLFQQRPCTLGFTYDILLFLCSTLPGTDSIEYFSDVDTMLPQCDFVAICCPLNASSRYMFKRKQFQLMKSTSILVNISRGKHLITLVKCCGIYGIF